MPPRGRGVRPSKIRLQPQEVPMANFLTSSGTFKDGDIIVNRDGLRVISQEPHSAPPQSQDASFNLDDLETVEVLGKGNSGIVHLARHKWTGQLFAVKVIQMNVEESVRRQIRNEMRINSNLNCPYAVVCFHISYGNGVISLVLEYMDRGSLADILSKCHTIPEPQLSIICRQVLKGLVHLHQEIRVIHRDLKPSNLLLNRMGEVKITDFGVSANLTSSMRHRETFVGTYKYMSPERVRGDTHSYDSDIWSLGLVILECALGHFPYLPPARDEEWQNFYELYVAIVGQPAPSASRDRFSVEFCSFISSCLQKEPTYRQSAVGLLRHPFITRYENYGNELLVDFIRQWIPNN